MWNVKNSYSLNVCMICLKLWVMYNWQPPVYLSFFAMNLRWIFYLQNHLQGRIENNQLLVDTKHTYPVLFPYTPSALSLETLHIPASLNLDFLGRVWHLSASSVSLSLRAERRANPMQHSLSNQQTNTLTNTMTKLARVILIEELQCWEVFRKDVEIPIISYEPAYYPLVTVWGKTGRLKRV